MAFVHTNFCCRSGGNNLNAGTLLGDTTVPGTTASFTYSGTFSTNTFTVSSGNPLTDGVTAGMFVQFSDGTNIGRICRVASVTSTTIVGDGTATVTVNAGTYTVAKVGGAWAGMSGTLKFPLTSITSVLTNTTGNRPRINFCNDQIYSVSTATTVSSNSITYQGFTTSYGDGGRPTWTGGSSGASFVPFTFSGSDQHLIDLVISQNGSTGTNNLFALAGSRQIVRNCDFSNAMGAGLATTSTDPQFINCRAYSNGGAGFAWSVGAMFLRCVAYSNAGAGFNNNGSNSFASRMTRCVSYNNTSHGFTTTGIGNWIYNCDFYNNGGSGANFAGTSSLLIWWDEVENCNFVKNGAYGIAQPSTRLGLIRNCGFGSGTQANTSGTVQSGQMDETGSITYAADSTPWNSPGTGDFTITLAAAKNAGYGAFPGGGFTGYPDIGAAQHQDVAAAGIFGIGMNGGFDS